MKWYFWMLIGLIPAAQAVEVQQGVIYEGSSRLESSQLGLSFQVPAGWQGAWPQGSEFFILESQALQSTVFMMIDQGTEQELRSLMSQPIPLDEQVVLQPVGQIRQQGKALIADYDVSGNPQYAARIAATSGLNNLAVAFIALAAKESAPQLQPVLDQLVNSLGFSQPKAPPAAATGGAGSWQDYMRGRYIVRMYTGSGYSEKEEVWLCSDGSFYRSTNYGGGGGGFSGAFAGKGHGSWQASGQMGAQGQLVLRYGQGSVTQGSMPGMDWQEQGAGGEVLTYSLAIENERLYLNGTKWFRDQNNYCQ